MPFDDIPDDEQISEMVTDCIEKFGDITYHEF